MSAYILDPLMHPALSVQLKYLWSFLLLLEMES